MGYREKNDRSRGRPQIFFSERAMPARFSPRVRPVGEHIQRNRRGKKTRPRQGSRRRAHTQNKAGASFSTERKGQETIWAYERFPEKRDRVSGLPEPGKRKPEPRDRPTKAARPEEENRNGARAEDTPGQQEVEVWFFARPYKKRRPDGNRTGTKTRPRGAPFKRRLYAGATSAVFSPRVFGL